MRCTAKHYYSASCLANFCASHGQPEKAVKAAEERRRFLQYSAYDVEFDRLDMERQMRFDRGRWDSEFEICCGAW